MEAELAELKAQVKQLTARVNKVQGQAANGSWAITPDANVGADEAEIRKIHFKYGYYLDKCLYKEVSSI